MHSLDNREKIIEVENVSFAYDAREVLRHINLSIHRGDYLALVGGNGSGKTTLLKIILGLLIPQYGSVRIFGTEVRDFKEWSRIGYVSQRATAFDPGFPVTAEEVVLMGRYGRRGMLRRVTGEDYRKTHEALRRVEMLEARGRLIGDLSSGQQQRVFIARALATEPEILFLDEPTVGVEKDAKDEFYRLLKRLNENFKLTVVLVTHDIESVAHEAMQVACIDCTLFFHDSVENYFKNVRPVTHQHA